MEALQLGAVQMLAPSLAKFGPLGREGIRGVRPALHLRRTTRDLHALPRARSAQGSLKPSWSRRASSASAFWDNGFKSFSANNPMQDAGRPEGKKCASSHPRCWKSRCARSARIPQVMAFSEAYQALQTGVVDGTENPHSNMYTQKMHEVQKHMA
jgi:C4-dicarboxylate-binding protein DctP